MSTKDFNKLNTFKKNQDNKNKKLDILNQKGKTYYKYVKGREKDLQKIKFYVALNAKRKTILIYIDSKTKRI